VKFGEFTSIVTVNMFLHDNAVFGVGEDDNGNGVVFFDDGRQTVLQLFPHLGKAAPHTARNVAAEDVVDGFTNLDFVLDVGVLEFVFVKEESLGNLV
jgi:hypothetical protein